MNKRVISLILAIAICLSYIPTYSVFAIDASSLDSGVSILSDSDSGNPSTEISSSVTRENNIQIEELQYYLILCELYLRAEHYAYLDGATDKQIEEYEKQEERLNDLLQPFRDKHDEFMELSFEERQDDEVISEYIKYITVVNKVDELLIKKQFNCTCTEFTCNKNKLNESCTQCLLNGDESCEYIQPTKKITEWEWISDNEMLNIESNTLELLGVSENNPIDFEGIILMLPTQIKAKNESEEYVVDLVEWECENYPNENAFSGSYEFYAKLSDDYQLSEDAAMLTVIVNLGGTSLLAASTTDITYPVTGGNIYFNASTGTITDCDETVTEAIIPNMIEGTTVKIIGQFAFSNCKKLVNVILPETLETIESGAFSSWPRIISINIPKSVTTIDCTFSQCLWLTEILVHADNPNYSSLEGVLFDKNQETLLRYPPNKPGTEYTVPKTVLIIDSATFNDNKYLTNLVIPDNVTTIESGAFGSCDNLTSVRLPARMETIPSSLFQHCAKLASVEIPYGITSIGNSAFGYCSSLDNITIPKSTTTIGEGAFRDCTSLSKIIIPGSVTSIAKRAFSGCTALESVTIQPDTTLSIGESAFTSCESLTELTLGEGITSIEKDAFAYCDQLASVTVPKTVTSIRTQTFGWCDNLAEINLPEGLVSIGNLAFTGSKISSVSIPETVTKLNPQAFSGCMNLTNIFIPANCTTLTYWDGGTAAIRALDRGFDNCGLTEIVVDENNPNYSSVNGVMFNKDQTVLLSYPAKKSGVSYRIPNTVKTIGYGAFSYTNYLASMLIPNNVITIGDSAFSNSSLSSVNIPNSVVSIGDFAFSETKLAYVTIPNSVTSVGKNAFSYNDNLVSIVISSGMTAISEAMLRDCPNLLNITVPNSIKRVEKYAFTRSGGITDIYYTGTEEEWQQVYIGSYNYYMDDATIHYNSPGPGSSISGDGSIIETVKGYTSGDMASKLEEITNSGKPSDVQFAELNDFFLHYGMTDPQEGLDYLSATAAMRMQYEYLLTDNLYCANNYVNELNNNLDMRLSLFLSSFLIGGEINDWLDFSTYLQSDYPGVNKYKAALLNFMQQHTYKLEVIDTAQDIQKTFNKVNVVVKNHAIASLESCNSWEEYHALSSDYAMKELYAYRENGDIKISETSGFGQYAKAMGHAGTGLKIFAVGYEDLMTIKYLDSTIKSYMAYKEFLEDIVNSTDDFPFEMRWAAQDILDLIDHKWEELAEDIVWDIVDAMSSINGLDTNMLNMIKRKYSIAGNLSELLGVIDLTSFAINGLFGIDTMVEQSAYTETFVLLADHWKKRLTQSAETFLDTPTEDNAWAFAKNYEMMRALRLQGETSYLEMCKVEGILGTLFDHQYIVKKEFVQPIISRLTEYQFSQLNNLEEFVGNNKLYAAKTIVECPVSVKVTDSAGNVIVELPGNSECDIENEYGRFVSQYRDYTGDYVKILYFNYNHAYNVTLQAYDYGLVSYTASSGGNIIKGVFHQALAIGDQLTISANTNVSDPTTANLITAESPYEENEIRLQEISLDSTPNVDQVLIPSEMQLVLGSSRAIPIQLTPSDSANNALLWVSKNPNVASIKNGTITANTIGTTTVLVYAMGSDNIAECSVNVYQDISVTGVTLDKTNLNIKTKGENSFIDVTIIPENATNKTVTWKTNNSDVAIVDNGVVTAVSNGIAEISATTQDGNFTAICIVIVDIPSDTNDIISGTDDNSDIDSDEDTFKSIYHDYEDDFWSQVVATIEKSQPGSKIIARAGDYKQMPVIVIKTLLKHNDILLEIHWNGGNIISIPSVKAIYEKNRSYYPLSYLESFDFDNNGWKGFNPKTGGVLEVSASTIANNIIVSDIIDIQRSLENDLEIAKFKAEKTVPDVIYQNMPVKKVSAIRQENKTNSLNSIWLLSLVISVKIGYIFYKKKNISNL